AMQRVPGHRRLARRAVSGRRAHLGLTLPVNFTDCGSCSALSMIISVPDCDPGAAGVKVTPIVHFAPGGSGALQLLVSLNGLTAPLTPSISTVTPSFFLLLLGLVTVTFFSR